MMLMITFTFMVGHASAQGSKAITLTLRQATDLARKQSPEALKARNRLLDQYWQNRTFRADYLPSLTLDATTPDLSSGISSIPKDDGTLGFVRSSNVNSSANLSLSQNIGLTGGSIFVNSGLQRIDVLQDTVSTSYLSTPVSIGIRQPILTFNRLYWSKKIEPLRWEEAKRQFLEDMEQVSIRATNLFFNLLIAQINLEISRKNVANNDTLYKIANGRYNLGKIAENELLQMELSLLNSQTALAQNRLDVQTQAFELRNFMGYKENLSFNLIPPVDVPDYEVDVNIAVAQAKKNRRKVIELDRQLLEAEREVARSRGENGFNANVFATYGLGKSAGDLNDVYTNPEDQQQFRIGVSIPILDWGKSKSQVRMAKANRELVQTTVEQEALSFEQEIYLRAVQFNILNSQLTIAAKSDTIAQKRFAVTKARYLIGKIDITELNIALEEKDVAKRGYFEQLRNYWSSYYNLRKLTLYDFEAKTPIPFREELR